MSPASHNFAVSITSLLSLFQIQEGNLLLNKYSHICLFCQLDRHFARAAQPLFSSSLCHKKTRKREQEKRKEKRNSSFLSARPPSKFSFFESSENHYFRAAVCMSRREKKKLLAIISLAFSIVKMYVVLSAHFS